MVSFGSAVMFCIRFRKAPCVIGETTRSTHIHLNSFTLNILEGENLALCYNL